MRKECLHILAKLHIWRFSYDISNILHFLDSMQSAEVLLGVGDVYLEVAGGMLPSQSLEARQLIIYLDGWPNIKLHLYRRSPFASSKSPLQEEQPADDSDEYYEGDYSEDEYPGYEFSKGEFSEDGFPDDETTENEELDHHLPNVPDWEYFEAELASTKSRVMNQRLVNIYALLKGKKCGITNGHIFQEERWTDLDAYRLDAFPFVILSHPLMVGRLLARAHVALFREKECEPALDRGLRRYMERNRFECDPAAEEEEVDESRANTDSYQSLFE